jgi:hypothetical protein
LIANKEKLKIHGDMNIYIYITFLGISKVSQNPSEVQPWLGISQQELCPCSWSAENIRKLSGWWFQHVSTPLKNISQLGSLFSRYGKMKNVPNHQPVVYTIRQKTSTYITR